MFPNPRTWKNLSLAACTAVFLMAGCSSESEELPPPTVEQLRAAKALITPAPLFQSIRYRITGIAGPLSGQYIGPSGAALPIPAVNSAAATWETTISMPIALMRSQGILLTARSNAGTPLTLEIWGDGKLIGTASGPSPRLTVRKH